jgi:acyl carrier protein
VAPVDRRGDREANPPGAQGSFADLLGAHVGLDLSGAGPGSLLREELGFDSLAMAEALVLLADRGVHLPDELVPEVRTLGDLCHYAGMGGGAAGSLTTAAAGVPR